MGIRFDVQVPSHQIRADKRCVRRQRYNVELLDLSNLRVREENIDQRIRAAAVVGDRGGGCSGSERADPGVRRPRA